MSKPRPYLDLTVELRDLDLAANRFTVTVAGPAVGESEAVTVPYAYEELEGALDDLEHKYLDQTGLVTLGQQLADRLLPPGLIRAMFLTAYQQTGRDGGLRLRLKIREPKLAQLPWEDAYLKIHPGEDDARHFLALNPQISFVRHPPLAKAQPHLTSPAPGPLRIVAALSNVQGPGYAKLKLDQERSVIEQAVAAAGTGEFSLVWDAFLEDATVEDLKLALLTKPDLFHFAGHGVFDLTASAADGRALVWGEPPEQETRQYGAIVLAADKTSRTPALFPAPQLAAALQQAGVRLTVLGACHSGRQDGHNPWTGVAPALIERGLPAVVAMQYAVRDEAAIAFNRMFYAALANGLSVDEAVAAGRQAMWTGAQRGGLEWGVPVLYMRARDGVIFPERLADPSREAARTKSQVRLNQQIAVLYGHATGAEIEQMIEGLIDVEQQVKTVGSAGTLTGVKIGTLGGPQGQQAERLKTEIASQSGDIEMHCTQCGTELPDGAKFCPDCGAKVTAKPAQVDVRQKLGTVEGEATGLVAGQGAVEKRLQASSEQTVETVKPGGTVTGAVIGGESPTYVGGEHQHGDTVQGDKLSGGVKISNVEGGIHGSTIAGRDVQHSHRVFDQRGQQVGTQHNVAGDLHQLGSDAITMSGNFEGAILNVKSSLANVSQTIEAIPNASPADKQTLKTLLARLDTALAETTAQAPHLSEAAEAVRVTAKTLLETAGQAQPNRSLLKISGEGLKQAAQDLAVVTPAVLSLATQIVETVLKLR